VEFVPSVKSATITVHGLMATCYPHATDRALAVKPPLPIVEASAAVIPKLVHGMIAEM